MKWFLVVFALVAVLCLPMTASAQCSNGQCQLGPPVVAVPGAFFGGPVTYAAPVYAAPVYAHGQHCQPAHREESPAPCQGPPVQFACGNHGPPAGCFHPLPWQSSQNANRGGSVGISLHWGRGCAARSSSGWR